MCLISLDNALDAVKDKSMRLDNPKQQGKFECDSNVHETELYWTEMDCSIGSYFRIP